jgi:hypothetical protein
MEEPKMNMPAKIQSEILKGREREREKERETKT